MSVQQQGPHRLVVRTSRCGRDNPGSTPGVDIFRKHPHTHVTSLQRNASSKSDVQSPATRNRTRDHLITAWIYSQMLCQLSYSRIGSNTCELMLSRLNCAVAR